MLEVLIVMQQKIVEDVSRENGFFHIKLKSCLILGTAPINFEFLVS